MASLLTAPTPKDSTDRSEAKEEEEGEDEEEDEEEEGDSGDDKPEVTKPDVNVEAVVEAKREGADSGSTVSSLLITAFSLAGTGPSRIEASESNESHPAPSPALKSVSARVSDMVCTFLCFASRTLIVFSKK